MRIVERGKDIQETTGAEVTHVQLKQLSNKQDKNRATYLVVDHPFMNRRYC
jgi:hypothetical protein